MAYSGVCIEARLAYKRSENSGQQSFGFRESAPSALRAVHTAPNEAARQLSNGHHSQFPSAKSVSSPQSVF
jgi:hypothetical protein